MNRSMRLVAASLTAATFLFSAQTALANTQPTPAWPAAKQQLDALQRQITKLDHDIHRMLRILQLSTRELRHLAESLSEEERKQAQENLVPYHEELNSAQALHEEIEDLRALYFAALEKKDKGKMRSVLELVVEKKAEQLRCLKRAHGELAEELQRVRKLTPGPPSPHSTKHL